MDQLVTAVRYLSKSGNTKKVAEAIAQKANCEAKTISSPITEYTDVLFLGAAVYWGGIDSDVKEYIQKLDKTKIGKVVVFSTSAMAQRAFPKIKECLQKKGIPVAEENFYCRGQFTVMHRNHPDDEDLKNAACFAEKFLR